MIHNKPLKYRRRTDRQSQYTWRYFIICQKNPLNVIFDRLKLFFKFSLLISIISKYSPLRQNFISRVYILDRCQFLRHTFKCVCVSGDTINLLTIKMIALSLLGPPSSSTIAYPKSLSSHLFLSHSVSLLV